MRWLLIPEENLAACTNGRVFHDGNGRFTSDSTSDFLLDHGPIVQARIRDPRIRELTVWYAGA